MDKSFRKSSIGEMNRCYKKQTDSEIITTRELLQTKPGGWPSQCQGILRTILEMAKDKRC